MLIRVSVPVALLALLPLAGLGGAEVVLHEPVPVPQLRCEGGVCRREDAPSSSLPEAVLSEDGPLRPPMVPATPREHEPIYNPVSADEKEPLSQDSATPGADPPPTRRTRVGPDRDTLPEAPFEHLYHEVFNPAVFPFKRMTVLDAVNDDETLRLRDPARSLLAPVSAGRLAEGRDPFFGSVVIEFAAERPVPLPSPAAGVRLLSFQSNPPAPLRFSRDVADNLYVTSPVWGRRRVTYLVDAAQRYFAGPLLPPEAPLPRLRDVPAAQLFRLPARVRRHALQVLQHIGVAAHRDDDYQATLSRLVDYFRAFEQGPLFGHSGSTYLDLALSQRGACRHRAYAFTITALFAGIPTRYVENELHVFVEVYVPDRDRGYWRRINLGGAPMEQRLFGTDNKVTYREKGGDPLPRPEAFRNTTPRKVLGLPPKVARGPERAGEPGASPGGPARGGQGTGGGIGSDGPARPGGNPAGPGSGPGQGGNRGQDRDVRPGTGSGSSDTDSPVENATAPERSAAAPVEDSGLIGLPDPRLDPPAQPLIPTSVTVGVAPEPAVPGLIGHGLYRGATVRVRGQVQARSGPSGGLEVAIFLDTPKGPLPLGRTTTAADGSYTAEVEVPAEAPFGDHRILTRVRGDESRRGSSSGKSRAH